MAAGAAIDEINTVRGALSAIKAGQLALAVAAPIVTLAVSDVIGDSLAVIGSGPTVGPWLASPGVAVDDGTATRRARARAILARHGLAVPAVLAGEPPARSVARADHAEVIAPMASAAQAAVRALAARGITATLVEAPLAGEVFAVAGALVAAHAAARGPIVAWGEPTLRVPAVHGAGGRAQQLALVLAGSLRGTPFSAFVVGTDGIDGPPPPDRPAPAGAWVDGATWDAIAAAGRDPAAALASCDAGTALAAAGALVVTGPSGINHADLAILG
jgi:hydroxypyruvate reductase